MRVGGGGGDGVFGGQVARPIAFQTARHRRHFRPVRGREPRNLIGQRDDSGRIGNPLLSGRLRQKRQVDYSGKSYRISNIIAQIKLDVIHSHFWQLNLTTLNPEMAKTKYNGLI